METHLIRIAIFLANFQNIPIDWDGNQTIKASNKIKSIMMLVLIMTLITQANRMFRYVSEPEA